MSYGSKTCFERALFVAVLGLVAGCEGPAPPDAGRRDAGRDAGRADAGRDAGRDGRADAGSDAGRIEAAWLPLAGLPDPRCQIAFAADPEATAGPLRFEPCPGLAGCRRLVVDWESRQQPRFTIVGTAGDHDGANGYFAFTRGAEPGWLWLVIARDDGRVLAVVRSPVPHPTEPFDCFMGPVGIGEGRTAFSVATGYGDGIGPQVVILVDPDGSHRVVRTLLPAEVGSNNYIAVLRPGLDFIGAQVVPRQDILRVGLDGSLAWLTGDEPGSPYLGSAIASSVVYDRYPAHDLWIATGPERGRLLLAPTDSDAVDVSSDGVDLVWAQMFNLVAPYEYDRVELWTAPFTTDPSALAPRRVAPLPVPLVAEQLYSGHGHALLAESLDRLSVYSLESGRIGVIRAPEGTEWRGTFVSYLGPEEAAVAPVIPGLVVQSPTIWFVRYDALPSE